MQTAQVIPFQFESKQVRAYSDDAGEPWFCAADVCKALGYANSRKAIADNCREKGVTSSYTLTLKGRQALTFINEGNLYRLIIKSRKEEAQRFEAWVCDEVLPSIRRTGHYEDTSNKMATLVDELIGMTEVNVIKGLIRDKAKVIPIDRRRGFQLAMHNRLHTRFNVPRVELIPAAQFESACNFIAAYALEGEWLPKSEQPQPAALLDYLLPPEQAKEIDDRLVRLGRLFHPFSDPFSDVIGISNALRGRDPKNRGVNPGYRQVLRPI